jgi:m7GpppX diphosphatase
MKWDGTTVSSLYLLAIVQDHTIRSLRDLRKAHVNLLKSIRSEALRIVREKWGLGDGSLRFVIHYQPSYYHFHVHIVNCNYQGNIMGLSVGQAHLLDTVISMLELDPDEGPGIFERMTLTYGLGKEHGVFKLIEQDAEAQR